MTSAAFDRTSLNRLEQPVDLHRMTVETPALRSHTEVKLTRSGAVPAAARKSGQSQPPAPVKKYSARFALLMAMATSVLIGAAVYFQPWSHAGETTLAAGHEVPDSRRVVQIARPTQAVTSEVVLPATIRPWQSATLHARASGYLTAWHKDLGAKVKAGELLAEIETPELDQEVAVGEALAHEAEAAAAQAKAERIEAEADLKVAAAQLVRIRAETELARTQLARREKLVVTRTIAKEEYDTFATQMESRNAEVVAAESDVIRRRSNLDTRTAIIDARVATAQSRQSNVERLKELQEFKRIVAPFDGIVTRRDAEVGMLVTAGQEGLFVVEDMSRVRVQLQVPQTYAIQTVPGVAATVAVPESSALAASAVVTRIADSVDTNNRTMLAEIEIENGSRRFQPGSYAQVTLQVPQGDAAWTVPTNTVAMRVAGPHVAVVNDQDRIELNPVKLGRDLGTKVVIAAGIHGNERLVVNPSDSLTNGETIQGAASQETKLPSIAQR
jgi:multidrug efflux pump subunit AcrA (membrane-fusion protein)